MTSREIAQEARLLVPTCRPQSSEVGQALLQKVAWLRRLFAAIRQERGPLSFPTPSPTAPTPLFQSVLSSNGTVYSRLRHTVSPPSPRC